MGLPSFTPKQKQWLKQQYPDLRFTTVDALLSREDGTSSNSCCFCCPPFNVAFSLHHYSRQGRTETMPYSYNLIGPAEDPVNVGGLAYLYDVQFEYREFSVDAYFPLVFISPFHLSVNMGITYWSRYGSSGDTPIYPLYTRELSTPIHAFSEQLYYDEPGLPSAPLPSGRDDSSFRSPPRTSHQTPLDALYYKSVKNPIDSSVDLLYYYNRFIQPSYSSSVVDPIYAAVYSLLKEELILKGV
ncbi:hypothetical protein [Wolinella succinogenes]|uniref:hypothetical protein n=1 Tax=Wolinella succinogenes TaxID=844 RepID=UPI002FC63C14